MSYYYYYYKPTGIKYKLFLAKKELQFLETGDYTFSLDRMKLSLRDSI